MRAVIQRVTQARVVIDGRNVGEIGHGVLVLVGVSRRDGPADVKFVAAKIRDLRIFDDGQGKMNRSLPEAGGSALVVPQFTLYGDCRKGRRPSFDEAAEPAVGRQLYEDVVRDLRANGIQTEVGVFQARMQIELVNDGPVTVLLDSERKF
jgi:D-aminoacyl-tRNA deacylase